jgi:hypothetical protein
VRDYTIEIAIIPQKKKHTRRIFLTYKVQGKNIQEARNEALGKAFQEGYKLVNYRIKELV